MGLSCGEVLLDHHFTSWLLNWGIRSRMWFTILEKLCKVWKVCSQLCIFISVFHSFLFSFTLLYRSLYCPLSLSAVLLWWCYGFIELVCGRNLWIKVISLSLRFSQDVKLPFTFVCFSERDSKRHMFQTHTRWLPGFDASSRAGGTWKIQIVNYTWH